MFVIIDEILGQNMGKRRGDVVELSANTFAPVYAAFNFAIHGLTNHRTRGEDVNYGKRNGKGELKRVKIFVSIVFCNTEETAFSRLVMTVPSPSTISEKVHSFHKNTSKDEIFTTEDEENGTTETEIFTEPNALFAPVEPNLALLADVSPELGSQAVEKLESEFGPQKNGTIHGVILGLDNYIKNFRSGDEGLLVNISSLAGIAPIALMPSDVSTKFAVHGLTLPWGASEHYDRTKVCTRITITPLITEVSNKSYKPEYEQLRGSPADSPVQNPEVVAPHVITVIEKAPSGTMWVVEGGEPPYEFKLPDRFTQPKIFLYYAQI
ncbi:hypothetical protein HUJ04_001822 [Dendroctonus ponderosae]|nr:hypothetical protein HUJ04_001822 [Dendroctonus ponderosae]